MCGTAGVQEAPFPTVHLEPLVPAHHPIRALRERFNTALTRIGHLFDACPADGGRESIAPELGSAPKGCWCYSIRSARRRVEQRHDELLLRRFMVLSLEAAVRKPSTFRKHRDRLLAHELVPAGFEEGVCPAEQRRNATPPSVTAQGAAPATAAPGVTPATS